VVKVLNLRVLAYSLDNGCIPEQTTRNMKNMADRLNAKLVIEKNECLKKCIEHHMSSFIRRPSAPMIGLLCTGCRLGMDTRISGFARENRIPVIISGSNPLDVRSYKQNIMALSPNSGKMYSYVLGYLLQVIRNPMWVLDYDCLVTQIKEYYHHFVRGPGRREDELQIAPFYRYIRWDEKEVTSKIENELDWRKHPDTESTWRGDCDIALLKLYLYREMLGYNDQDEGLSYLVRDGQISREQALERLKEEGDVPEDVIKEILGGLRFDFSNLKMALEPVRFSQSVSHAAAF
jgi:hypothetical protein